jgi:hypothetical protein
MWFSLHIVLQVERVVDELSSNNGSIDEMWKANEGRGGKKTIMLWCKWDFCFLRGKHVSKANEGCLGTLFNGCPLCGSLD